MKILFAMALFSQFAFAAKGAEDYVGKYMFTHAHDPKLKEYDDVISKCFKITGKTVKALASYDLCDGNVVKQAPMQKALGHCVRKKDDATGYIFETKKDCEQAQADTADGAAT
jgi:hypothetical protein